MTIGKRSRPPLVIFHKLKKVFKMFDKVGFLLFFNFQSHKNLNHKKTSHEPIRNQPQRNHNLQDHCQRQRTSHQTSQSHFRK